MHLEYTHVKQTDALSKLCTTNPLQSSTGIPSHTVMSTTHSPSHQIAVSGGSDIYTGLRAT